MLSVLAASALGANTPIISGLGDRRLKHRAHTPQRISRAVDSVDRLRGRVHRLLQRERRDPQIGGPGGTIVAAAATTGNDE